MNTYLRSLINWILPIVCVLCGQKTGSQQPNICPACVQDLPWIITACARCGLPLAQSHATCGACLGMSLPYQHLQALFRYEFPVDQLILGLKFNQRLLYARLLGSLLAKRCAQYYTTGVPLPAMLIPVPLHTKRLRKRGYNQAAELAKWVSRRLHVPLARGYAQRVKYTEAQAELPLALRARNMQNAFVVKQPIAEHIAIIDDVVTSSHTIQTLSNVLARAGAKRIDVWCIARAIKN